MAYNATVDRERWERLHKEIGEVPLTNTEPPEFEFPATNKNKDLKTWVKEFFDKFDEYACIKDDKWYKDFKKEKLKELGWNDEK